MGALSEAFEDRLDEITAYLDFLEEIEKLATAGVPRLGGTSGAVVTPQQTRILYSSVYLQLYSLVEATITRCLDQLTNATLADGRWLPADMVAALRREWVRVMVGSHKDLNYENRLRQAFDMCDHLVGALPVTSFKLERGGGGNWDDKNIEAIAKRIGMTLKVSAKAKRGVKQKFRDEMGALGLVVKLRNDLAHGSLSFAECGENDTVSELRDLTTKAATYMREVVTAFESFIDEHQFLVPEKRPVAA